MKNENTCNGIMGAYLSRHIFDYFFCDRGNIVLFRKVANLAAKAANQAAQRDETREKVKE